MDALRARYPNRVPVKVASKQRLKREKFLVPHDMNLHALLFVLRKHMDGVGEKDALFVNVEGTVPRLTATLGELEAAHCRGSAALCVYVNKESVFG